MAHSREFHEKPYDAGTLAKLEILRAYLRNWLPKFKKYDLPVYFIDYFCGPGCDSEGRPGSPIVAVEEVELSLVESDTRRAKHAPVIIILNDISPEKIDSLRELLSSRRVRREITIQISNDKFEDCFAATTKLLRSSQCACLAYIDQFGVKYVTRDVFLTLINSPKTDVLFFVASAYLKRFMQEPEFQAYHQIDPAEIAAVEMHDVHRYVCNQYYRKMIPSGFQYFLAPYSIKKGDNVYGLIFGSRSLRGLQAFLEVAWKADPVSGSANFNIEGETIFGPDELPIAPTGPTGKEDHFRCALIAEIKQGNATNKSLFQFTLENGFLPRHANTILHGLRKRGSLRVKHAPGSTPDPIRKPSFYLDWDSFRMPPRVTFEVREERDGH